MFRTLAATATATLSATATAASRSATAIYGRAAGDVQRLKSDLSKLIPEERITIGLGGTKLKIVGDYVKVIKDWFVARNF
eukprot:jgi/Hompol1/64/HPOL_003130-RA